MSLQGILSTYSAGPSKTYPYFTSGDLSSKRAVVFISGLSGGLMDVEYIAPLSSALEDAGWKLVQMHWSGAYDGYLTGSLDRDVAEMGALVEHLRSEGSDTIVIMGHSTGSQDVLHYLTSLPASRPSVDGGIMQAPVSDREYFEQVDDEYTKSWRSRFAQAEKMVKEGKGDELLDWEFCREVGMVTAYRLYSLYAKGGDDDYFSSDIPDEPTTPHAHPLSSSFGSLTVPALALWSENDQFSRVASPQDLLTRWENAGKGRLQGRIVRGAGHAVEEHQSQKQLCDEVIGWLQDCFDRNA